MYNQSQIVYVLAIIMFVFSQVLFTVKGVFLIKKIVGKMDLSKRKIYFDSHWQSRFSTIRLEKFITETENQPNDEVSEFNKKFKFFFMLNILLVALGIFISFSTKV